MKSIFIISVCLSVGLPVFTQEFHLDVEGSIKLKGRVEFGVDHNSDLDSSNTFVGTRSGANNRLVFGDFGLDGGTSNTYVGAFAGELCETGSGNTFVGRSAGRNNLGPANTFIGRSAGISNEHGVANTYVGFSSGLSATGSNNTYTGYLAGQAQVQASGDFNTAFGSSALSFLRDGSDNTALGYRSGLTLRYGDHNVFLGTEAGPKGFIDSISNAIAIGFNAVIACEHCASIGGTGENAVKVGIGIDSPQTVLHIKQMSDSGSPRGGIRLEEADGIDFWNIQKSTTGNLVFRLNGGSTGGFISASTGSYATISDKRVKEQIRPLSGSLGNIIPLNPVYYHLKEDLDQLRTIGLIAQEVQQLWPELVLEQDDQLAVNYDGIAVLAIQAIKELTVMNNKLRLELSELRQQVDLHSTILKDSNYTSHE